ncbi:MAG: hypothetical protein MI922_18200 [Bacteroidales bacterium]|nr:hypothetical protein [Bacteroidales bacterium]
MEKLIKLFCALFLASTMFISCDKDDDDENEKNHFTSGGKEYTLTQGAFENYGLTDTADLKHDGYNLDLVLLSDGFTISTDSVGDMDITGTGQYIYFELFTSKGTEFDSREYTYSESIPYPIGTFDYSEFNLNYSEDIDDNEIEITSGKVTISKDGDMYSISIDCIDENNNAVTGFYKGTLKYYDYTVEEKSASTKSAKKIKNKK